jgi:hypothetical protein
MNKHVYEPLSSDEHIRIMALHPSEAPSLPLTCSIQQLKLDDNVKDYGCISYFLIALAATMVQSSK